MGNCLLEKSWRSRQLPGHHQHLGYQREPDCRDLAFWARARPMCFSTHGSALSGSIQGHGSEPFADPFAGGRDPLAGGNGRGVANHGHDVTIAPVPWRAERKSRSRRCGRLLARRGPPALPGSMILAVASCGIQVHQTPLAAACCAAPLVMMCSCASAACRFLRWRHPRAMRVVALSPP